jgi:GT2 family glycosyltransferase
MRIGVATIAAGRCGHLRRQMKALEGTEGIERYVVVSMDEAAPAAAGAEVVSIRADPGRLPLAAARNLAMTALDDLDLAILLDVDCIPGPDLVDRYRQAARMLSRTPALMCGPVGYLDPLPAERERLTAPERRTARTRVIRRFPRQGVAREPRAELFWSLSFAVTPSTHQAIGGFDEGYVGYGAEDTDYGLTARAAGIGLWMVGGAWAYHQHHAPSPPGQLAAVVANANRFRDRWGRWPMPDRLREFASEGAIRWDPATATCELAN